MSGGSARHSLIAANFVGLAWQSLPSKPCDVYNSDLRVKVLPSGLYTYPDATILCGDLEFDDDEKDTVTNPTVLVEVLSKSTETYDRGTKSALYREISSLRELLLVNQTNPHVERYVRQNDGGWSLYDERRLDNAIPLDSTDIEIPMSELYRGVEFDENWPQISPPQTT